MTPNEWMNLWDKEGLHQALRVRDERFNDEVGRATSH
jgi:hypothetical protein